MLQVYYIGFLCIMGFIILVQLIIVIISSRGTITNIEPRKHMTKFLYIRSFLILIEAIWSIIGIVWISRIEFNKCNHLVYFSVLANILFCGLAVFFLLFVLFIVFDPISHLDEKDVVKKQNVLNYYINKLCCCFYCCLYTGNSRRTNYENSYKQISRSKC
jgi:hypothetical protein